MLQNNYSIYVGLDVVEKSAFMVTSQINSKVLITYF